MQGVLALRGKSRPEEPISVSRKPRKNLADILSEPPFAGSELNLERQKGAARQRAADDKSLSGNNRVNRRYAFRAANVRERLPVIGPVISRQTLSRRRRTSDPSRLLRRRHPQWWSSNRMPQIPAVPLWRSLKLLDWKSRCVECPGSSGHRPIHSPIPPNVHPSRTRPACRTRCEYRNLGSIEVLAALRTSRRTRS